MSKVKVNEREGEMQTDRAAADADEMMKCIMNLSYDSP